MSHGHHPCVILFLLLVFHISKCQNAYNFVPPPLRIPHPIENDFGESLYVNVGRGVAASTPILLTRPAVPYLQPISTTGSRSHGLQTIPGHPLPIDFTRSKGDSSQKYSLPIRVSSHKRLLDSPDYDYHAFGETIPNSLRQSSKLELIGEFDSQENTMNSRLKDKQKIPNAKPLPLTESNSKVSIRVEKISVEKPVGNMTTKVRRSRAKAFAAPTAGEDDYYDDEDKKDEGTIEESAVKLPECYRTAGGFICCNKILEELMYASNKHVEKKNLSKCNVHALVDSLQDRAQDFFQTTFEIIVGTGDFASKTRFKDDLICKTIIGNKVVLIYATPEPYSLTETNTPLSH